MVPKAGLEPARLSPLPPQDSVSTNSTTSALGILMYTYLFFEGTFVVPGAWFCCCPGMTIEFAGFVFVTGN